MPRRSHDISLEATAQVFRFPPWRKFKSRRRRARQTVLRSLPSRPMQQGQASVTALGAAGHRAAHQVLERGFVFADPLALRILGSDADGAIALAKERPERRGLRLFIAMRSRFAEDSARRAIDKGRAADPGSGRRSRHLRLSTRADPGTADLRARSSGDASREAAPAQRGANRRASACLVRRSRFRKRQHDRRAQGRWARSGQGRLRAVARRHALSD